jgi:hypothetical protein
MFIRSIKVASSSGTVHEYVRIVGSVRENGKVKQKVIANLGRRDTLEAVLPLLNRFLQGDEDEQQLARQLGQEGPLEVVDASRDALADQHVMAPEIGERLPKIRQPKCEAEKREQIRRRPESLEQSEANPRAEKADPVAWIFIVGNAGGRKILAVVGQQRDQQQNDDDPDRKLAFSYIVRSSLTSSG